MVVETRKNEASKGTIGQSLYLDTKDYTILKDSGTVEVGVIAGENAEKDSIYAKVKL